ncbi:hypothetical protein AMECASPLE_013878 [Ameca splendens]|uniref:Uncharacterized protein n=1 Tax=Ameca splendens TaxID=208324 RepID=A0ABV0ZAB5_9TELE
MILTRSYGFKEDSQIQGYSSSLRSLDLFYTLLHQLLKSSRMMIDEGTYKCWNRNDICRDSMKKLFFRLSVGVVLLQSAAGIIEHNPQLLCLQKLRVPAACLFSLST